MELTSTAAQLPLVAVTVLLFLAVITAAAGPAGNTTTPAAVTVATAAASLRARRVVVANLPTGHLRDDGSMVWLGAHCPADHELLVAAARWVSAKVKVSWVLRFWIVPAGRTPLTVVSSWFGSLTLI